VDHSEEFLPALSLCSGILGLDRGAERVIGPTRTIAYVEIEAALIENLVVGMEAGKLAAAPIWSNARTFPWRHFRGKIFLLLGGYPCQPFSTAGKRKGTSDPRHLWPYFERGIDTARPVCVWFENVLGHLSLGFDQVTAGLRAMGYAVEAGIYTAAEIGAPHKRARVFILGILADAKDYVRGLYERRWRSGEAEVDVAGADEDVVYADIRRQQQWNPAGVGWESKSCSWPAGPGEPQYPWEHSRTLEPGLGLSVNGYDFRPDILRALGNGVVEEQAEYAMRDLLRKHFER